MTRSIIYLDSHATTPVDPRVLDEMLPYFGDVFGNASSTDHAYGAAGAEAVEKAREIVARSVGARSSTEIIFTSGATESNNTAILGIIRRAARNVDRRLRPHMITCTTEHNAVLDVVDYLEAFEIADVTRVSVDEYGVVNPSDIEAAITPQTRLVSIMAANNEIGTVADLSKIGRIVHDHNVLFHTDAAQAVGHIPMDVERMQIDLMSFSAHKMYGPKGVGALYVRGLRPRITIEPILRGGGQERNIRSGTLNVPGIVGIGAAVRIALHGMDSENRRHRRWASQMMKSFAGVDGTLNGHPEQRLARNLSIYFPGIESRAIINSVSDSLAISAGSACTTQAVEPSHVLLAIGHDAARAHSTVRVGLGRFNTDDEIRQASELVTGAVNSLRRI